MSITFNAININTFRHNKLYSDNHFQQENSVEYKLHYSNSVQNDELKKQEIQLENLKTEYSLKLKKEKVFLIEKLELKRKKN